RRGPAEDAAHGYRRLLRAARERPRDRRAAEGSQQFPPSDGDCHTPLPCEVREGRDTTPRACSLHVREGGDTFSLDRHAPTPAAGAGLIHGGKGCEFYSITRSARASTVSGIVAPRAFAVRKLIDNSTCVGCWTGRSAGFAPVNIFFTYSAVRRYMARLGGP